MFWWWTDSGRFVLGPSSVQSIGGWKSEPCGLVEMSTKNTKSGEQFLKLCSPSGAPAITYKWPLIKNVSFVAFVCAVLLFHKCKSVSVLLPCVTEVSRHG